MFKNYSFLRKQRFWKHSQINIKWLKYILILLFSAFNFIQCSFDKPSAPSWDVEVAIPLISKGYTMAEIADDETSLNVDSTGLLNLEVEADLDNYYVGDQLNLDNIQDTFTKDLGSFNVDSPGSEFTHAELREIFAQADNLHGQTVIVPAFSFTTDKKYLNPYDDFSYVVIDTGNISLQVENNLAVSLGSPLSLEIWDSALDTLISSTTTYTQILPGATAQFQINLQDKTLPNQLAVRLIGKSPGSEGAPILVDANSNFRITSSISNLQVREALAQIPAQRVSSQEVVTIDDSLVIMEAVIENGTIEMSIEGDLPLDAWLIYEMPDFISPTGTALVDSFFITKNSNPSLAINLNDYSLQPQVADFGKQTVRFSWTIKTIDTGLEKVLVKSSDLLHANFNLSEVRFSQVTGKMGEEEIDIEQKQIEFDLPADLDSVFFETARMELIINNGINFPANINFEIEGQNEAGALSHLIVDDIIQPAIQPGVPKTTVIVLDQQNSDIKEFISILPSLIRVVGKVKLSDENWVGTVSENDFVNGKVKISAPFALKLPSQSIDADAIELDIDDDVKEDIIDNLSSGTFFAEIRNHLPLGASVEFVFAQNDSTLYDSPILHVGPIRADAATLDANGYVQNALDSDVTFDLTEDEMRTFLKSPLYAGIRVLVDGTNNKFIKVRGSDYIQIKSYSKIKVKINQN